MKPITLFNTALVGATLLGASTAAVASDSYGYGRVVTTAPHFSVSYSSGYHDNARVHYGSGGHGYRTYTEYHPVYYYAPPPRHVVYHGYAPPSYKHHGYGHARKGHHDYGRHGGHGKHRGHHD